MTPTTDHEERAARLAHQLLRTYLERAAREAGAPPELHAQIAADRLTRAGWKIDDYGSLQPPNPAWTDPTEHARHMLRSIPERIVRDTPATPAPTPTRTPTPTPTPTARKPWELSLRDARNLKSYLRAKDAAIEHGADVVIIPDPE